VVLGGIENGNRCGKGKRGSDHGPHHARLPGGGVGRHRVRVTGSIRIIGGAKDAAGRSGGPGAERLRQIGVIRTATLAIVAIGALSVYHHWRLGLLDVCAALALAMTAALANLALLKWTRRPWLSGHLALVILTGFLCCASAHSVGFRDPSFAWFYVVPLAAAVFVGLRGAAAWLGIILAITVGFWSLEAAGIVIPDRIPVEMRNAHALFNHLTAILGLCMVASSFVLSQRRAERRLAAANAELRRESTYVRVLEHAAVAANEAATLEEAMHESVKRICAAMSWPVGHVYALGKDEILRTAHVFHIEDTEHFRALRDKTLTTTFRSGEGLPGRALASGRPEAFYFLPARSNGPRAGLAHQLGLNTAFAIPVMMHGRVAAVLEFASRERMLPDLRLLDVLAYVGVQIGRVAERAALQQRVRQSQKLEAVGRLAAGVAHEINNPMGFVHANLHQMNEYLADLRSAWEDLAELRHAARVQDLDALRVASERAEATIERIDVDFVLRDFATAIRESQEGSERIRHIVQDLRDFSHQDTGERVLSDVNQCLDSTANIVWPMMKHLVVLEKNYADLPEVPCYPMQLKQVFMNLLVNAFQAIEERVGESGEVGTISLSTERRGEGVMVVVRDTGVGIAPEHLDRIFDPFFTTKSVGAGTGLGLSTSFNIVQRHGGALTVESRRGEGAAFCVFLPLLRERIGSRD